MAALSRPRPHRQAGVSLIELLIGITLGLFIVGAGLTLLVVHLRESRALIAQSRLMQDLRATTDLIARDLRRAGYWGDAAAGVWPREAASPASGVAANPYTMVAVSGTSVPAITYRYSRDAVENGTIDSNEQFGFRLRSGALEMRVGAGGWQAMTDVTSMRVTRLDIAPTEERLSLEGSCQVPCPADSPSCPPQLHVRSVSVTVTGRGVAEAGTERTVRTRVRLRNDEVTGRCPA